MEKTNVKSAYKHTVSTDTDTDTATDTATANHLGKAKAPRRPDQPTSKKPSTIAAINAKSGQAREPHIAGPARIDKLELALYENDLKDYEAEEIVSRLKAYVKDSKDEKSKIAKRFTRGSAKGDCFKKVYLDRLPGGALIKYALMPTRPHIKQRLKITLNPNHMDEVDAKKAVQSIAHVLGHRAELLLPKLMCTRVDLCVDLVNVNINDLIISFKDVRSHGLVYVHADRGGKVQTMYLGSVQSKQHAAAYDQNAADEYKKKVGEKVMDRTKMADDAEVSMTPDAERTRLEVRTVLKKPLALDEIADLPSALSNFEIYDMKPGSEKKMTSDFLAYLDCVRLRGLPGAKAHFQNVKGGTGQLKDWQAKLDRYLAVWWVHKEFAKTLRPALAESTFWNLLQKKING